MSDIPARITVRVQPKAKRSEVVRWQDGAVRVRVTAAPEKGRANHAVVQLLSEVLGIPKSAITIERGATSRTKVVRIEGLSEEEVRGRVDDNIEGGIGR